MTTTSVRTRYGVDRMTEGDWLVRGTSNPMKALELVVEHGHKDGDFEDMLDGVAPGQIYRIGQGMVDNKPDPERIAAMADWCFDMLSHARPGYYRKVNCLGNSYGADENWSWQLGYATGPGRGVFEGVYFCDW